MSTYTIPIKLSHLILVGIGYVTGKVVQRIHDEVYISKVTFDIANKTVEQALMIAGIENNSAEIEKTENTDGDTDGR